MVGKVRKLSLTINLNSPGDYEGGNLKFDFGMHCEKENRFHECEEIRPQGSMVVFPSFVDHCVTPVTKGTRYSLVLWTLGEPWK
jgi:PKHD-type hydroxylase